MTIGEACFAAIDFEGAGEMQGYTDVPIQIGIAEAAGLTPPALEGLYRSFIAADRPVALVARQVHGISDADLQGAPELLSLWPELKRRLGGRVLVAHNAGVERRYLRAFPAHGFGPWIDTLALARKFYPQLPSHTLGSIVENLQLQSTIENLCPGLKWHDALFDAVASLVFLQHLIKSAALEKREIKFLF